MKRFDWPLYKGSPFTIYEIEMPKRDIYKQTFTHAGKLSFPVKNECIQKGRHCLFVRFCLHPRPVIFSLEPSLRVGSGRNQTGVCVATGGPGCRGELKNIYLIQYKHNKVTHIHTHTHR